MSEIYAAQDANQFPALLAHYGNVGTSNGTSTPVKLAADPATGALLTSLYEVVPTDATKTNPSFSYDIAASSCVVSQVIGTTTYQKTYDWSTNPITESAWA